MKNSILILSLIFVAIMPRNSFAQQIFQEGISDSIRVEAKNRTNELMQSLGLTTKQALLVEDKLAKFMVEKRKVLQKNVSAKQKAVELHNLEVEKIKEMRDILRQVQYDLYVKLEERSQP